MNCLTLATVCSDSDFYVYFDYCRRRGRLFGTIEDTDAYGREYGKWDSGITVSPASATRYLFTV